MTAALGIDPDKDTMRRHFTYFGPAPEGLLRHVGDPTWCAFINEASDLAERCVEEEPRLRFELWGKPLDRLQGLVAGMVNPDPARRLTMDQVMAHSWWQQAEP